MAILKAVKKQSKKLNLKEKRAAHNESFQTNQPKRQQNMGVNILQEHSSSVYSHCQVCSLEILLFNGQIHCSFIAVCQYSSSDQPLWFNSLFSVEANVLAYTCE